MLGLTSDGLFGGFPAALRRWRVPTASQHDLRRLVLLLHRGSTPADLDLLLPRYLRPLAEDLVARGGSDGWLHSDVRSDVEVAEERPDVVLHDTATTGWRGLGDTTALVGQRDVALVVHGPETVVVFLPVDTAACTACVARWYLGTRQHPAEMFEALSCAVAMGRARRTVPQAQIDDALQALTGSPEGSTGRAGFAVVAANGPRHLHWVGRHPSCTCAAPSGETIDPRRPLPRPRPHKVRDLTTLLVARAVIGGLRIESLPAPDGRAYAVAQAPVNSAYPHAVTAPLVAFGDAHEEDLAALRCIGEAVERFCTFHPERGGLVRATFGELGREALPPASLPLFSPEQYARDGFAYRAPDDVTPYLWTRGTSLSDGRSLWVHAEAAFPGCALGAPLQSVTSTGVAAHPDRDTAVLSALLEVVERDALSTSFLLRQLPPQLLVEDEEVLQKRRALSAEGFRLRLFDLTGDVGIPVVLAVADRPGGPAPYLLKGAAASLDVDEALHQALREVWRGFLYFGSRPALVPTDPAKVDPASVEFGMAYYQSDTALATLDVLQVPVPGPDAETPLPMGRRASLAGLDPVTAVQAAVDILTGRGFAPLVVDCTLPVAREAGFHVARVIVPGMVPLAFGRRPWHLGGDRLDRIATAAGSPGVRPDRGETGGPPHFFT